MVTEKMIEALKPCPFCGGSDIHLRHHQANQMSWVSCVGCGFEAPSETGVTDDDAVNYWNRRDAWRDISTAPKDGTIILLVGGAYHGNLFAGFWCISPYSPERPWVSVVNNSNLYEHVPTHWMPLPAAPAAKQEEKP